MNDDEKRILVIDDVSSERGLALKELARSKLSGLCLADFAREVLQEPVPLHLEELIARVESGQDLHTQTVRSLGFPPYRKEDLLAGFKAPEPIGPMYPVVPPKERPFVSRAVALSPEERALRKKKRKAARASRRTQR